MQALAHTHDLIADEDWQGVTIANLVNRQLEPFAMVGRLEASGPHAVLTPLAAQNIGLAWHKLATNAARHGAFSVAGGKVQLRWHIGEDDVPMLVLLWREGNGPAIRPPTRQGFGSTVLTQITPIALDGTAALSFQTDGVQYRLEVPRSHTRLELAIE